MCISNIIPLKKNISVNDKNFKNLSGYYKRVTDGEIVEVSDPADGTHYRHYEEIKSVKYYTRLSSTTSYSIFCTSSIYQEDLLRLIESGHYILATKKEFDDAQSDARVKYATEFRAIKPNRIFYSYDNCDHYIVKVIETYKIENEEPEKFEPDKYRVVFKKKHYEDIEYDDELYNEPYYNFRIYKPGTGVEENNAI